MKYWILHFNSTFTQVSLGVFDNHDIAKNTMANEIEKMEIKYEKDKYNYEFSLEEIDCDDNEDNNEDNNGDENNETNSDFDKKCYVLLIYSSAMGYNIQKIKNVYENVNQLPNNLRKTRFSRELCATMIINKLYEIGQHFDYINM